MRTIKLLTIPDPILQQQTVAIDRKDIPALIADYIVPMNMLMEMHKGIGLAAPQIGILLSFFITKIENWPVLFNPIILKYSKEEITMMESCLSIPNRQFMVKRPQSIKLRYMDERGNTHIKHIGGTIARVVQHEFDHLNGLLIDRYPEVTPTE